MSQKTFDGVAYNIGNLDTFTQFHVGRRIMPIVGRVLPAIPILIAEGVTEEQRILLVAPMVAGELSQMTDADSEYVIHKCLAVVKRKDETGGWAKMMDGRSLMFQDIKLNTMIGLVLAVIKENMGDFFTIEALQASVQTSASPSAT